MSGVTKIEIFETVDELKELLKATENQEVKEKQVKTTLAIANLIGKHRIASQDRDG